MTPAQLEWVKRQLVKYADSFSDAQLNDLYDDAEDAGASNKLYGTVALAYYQILSGAIELTNFRQGETQEWESVIYDRLLSFYRDWYNRAGFPTPLPTFNMNTIRLHYIEFPEDE